MAARKGSKAVAKKDEQALAVASDLVADAGAGLASDVDDYALPFIRVAQALTPQLDKNEPVYIKELEQGDIFNTVTSEVWEGSEGILVVPCLSRTDFIVWRPKRGGFVASYNKAQGAKLLAQCTRDEKNRDILPDGNILQRTGTTFCLVIDEETFEAAPAILALTSTQYKYWRKWNSVMQTIKLISGGKRVAAPAYACVYRLSTVQESNDQGKWHSWVPQLAGPIEGLCGKMDISESESILLNANVLQAARDFLGAVQQGEAQVDYSKMEDDATATAAPPEPPAGEDGDDDVM